MLRSLVKVICRISRLPRVNAGHVTVSSSAPPPTVHTSYISVSDACITQITDIKSENYSHCERYVIAHRENELPEHVLK